MLEVREVKGGRSDQDQIKYLMNTRPNIKITHLVHCNFFFL